MEQDIKSADLSRLYRNWRAALLQTSGLPEMVAFESVLADMMDRSFLVRIEPLGFRFVSVGGTLTRRLGRSLEGEFVDGDTTEMFGSLKAAYRNCAARQVPCYEFMRCKFDDGPSLLFERLVLPFFDPRGTLTHLGGAVSFQEIDASNDVPA